MYAGNELKSLIGKTDKDNQVIKLMADLGYTKPLKRPKRGEQDVNLVANEKGVELLFRLAEALPERLGDQFQEGELVLYTIFFRPVADPTDAIYKDLPGDIQFATSRESLRALWGAPEISSPKLPIDRWDSEGFKFHVRYKKDEKSIETLSVFPAD